MNGPHGRVDRRSAVEDNPKEDPVEEPVCVLIVEDLVTDAELAQREIRKTFPSSRFLCVDTREGFLDALKSFQPDIIVSDFRMPRFDGLTALKLAQEHAPLTPLIILTAAMNEDTAVECMKSGAVDYVIKEHIKRLGQSVLLAMRKKRLRKERREAEEALRESEKRYRILFQHANDAILLLDFESHRIIDFNDKASEMVGYSRAELREMTIEQLHPPEEWKRVGEIFAHVAVKGSISGTSGLHYLTKDGRLLDIEASGVRLELGDRTVKLSIVRDLTERRRAHEQRHKLERRLIQAQKMESIGRLAGGIAHDFNNMLSVILGHVEMIKSRLSREDPILRQILEIEKAAIHSRDITRQLLTFSRSRPIAPEPLQLNDHIKEIQKTLVRLIGEDIQLHFRPGKDLWTIRFDPCQMDQVIMNLAVNARDAMPDGGGLSFETANMVVDAATHNLHSCVAPGEYVLLEMSDNGIGMTRETLLYIFEPFFTTKERGRGTGLGLATVYGIVKQNGGFIKVYSEPNLGTTFKVYIPRSDEKEAPPKEKEAPLTSGAGTILLVEDAESVRELITEILETIGYTVLAPKTPSQALTLVEKEDVPIDLLLTDVVMPEMNGVELWDKISASRPGLKVLFMSGYTPDVIAHRGILKEGLHFIQKPFSMRDIARKIREIMEMEGEGER